MNNITKIVITRVDIQSVPSYPVAFDTQNYKNFMSLGYPQAVPPIGSEIIYPQYFIDSEGNELEIGMLEDVKKSLGFILNESFSLANMLRQYAGEISRLRQRETLLENKLFHIQNLNLFQRFIFLIAPKWAEEKYVNN